MLWGIVLVFQRRHFESQIRLQDLMYIFMLQPRDQFRSALPLLYPVQLHCVINIHRKSMNSQKLLLRNVLRTLFTKNKEKLTEKGAIFVDRRKKIYGYFAFRTVTNYLICVSLGWRVYKRQIFRFNEIFRIFL